ncbi:MAG: leucine-rich repeat domain-containing protein, partial [Clostridia bacterium]|nr:leucine-rich repeat domain-containing protein [Clostridia bacterium]
MNSSKKLIALLTALVLLFAAFPLGGLVSRAAEIIEGGDCGKYGDNVTWTLDSDGVLTISGEGDMCSFGWWNKTESSPFYGNSEILFVNIESGVTSIGSEVFSGCTGLKSVMIPDSVTSIGDSAFSGCTRLTDLTVDAKNSVYYSIGNCIIAKETKTLVSGCKNSAIPNDGSVTRIEAGAFSGCAGLQSMTIPDEITSIGGKAFADCTGLMSVTIPDGVTFIGKEAFSGCAGLTSVTIPDSVTKISDSTFSGCSGLTSVTIPNSVTSIGDSAFSGCTGLASLTIPDSVTSIGSSAFSNCTGLTSVTIPDRVTSIEVELFYGCTGLTSVTLPDGVTSIGGNAFFACTSLTSVMIPAGVTSIESSAFSGCTGLSELTVDTNNPVYFSAGNCIIEKEKNSLVIACDNSEIPDDGCVTSIGFGAFSRCTGLNSVKIPEGVTSIGSYAFFGCTGLTSVIIPDSVTRIEWGAFSGCTNLTSLTIPDSVTTISQEMFIDCENLTAITISNDVTRIYKDAFLGTAYYNDKTNWEDGALYLGAALIRVDRETVTENYKIKEGTRIIADNAFECCDSLMSIAIPKSVKNIGDSAFECCSILTSVMIPDSITSIGGRAFFKCSSLTSVTIPDSVKSIDGSAFYACTNLKSVAIPDSVTSIGGAVFSGCTSLASIFIPESVTEIGWAAIPKSTVIFGYVGSYAQQWAEENDLAFQPIGDVTVTLTVPEVVNEPTVNVHGLANPDAKVICFVNGNETVTVTASASCRWNATIPLTGAKDGDSFTIAAAVTLDGTTAEQTATVTYEPDAVVFHEFTLNHRCYRVTVEGERLGVSIPNITYV